MRESTIEQMIRTYIKVTLGGVSFKGSGKRGSPDILACINGEFVGIEVKAKGRTPRLNQLLMLDEINRSGGIAFWVDSYESAVTKLNEL